MPDPLSPTNPNAAGGAILVAIAFGIIVGYAFAFLRPLRMTVAGALILFGAWSMVGIVIRSATPGERVFDISLVAPMLSLGLGVVICAVDRDRLRPAGASRTEQAPEAVTL